MLDGRAPVGQFGRDGFEVTSTAQLFGTEALGHPAHHLRDVTKLCSLDEWMRLAPKDLSFLAASAPRVGSNGGLGTRKGYRPRIRSSRNGSHAPHSSRMSPEPILSTIPLLSTRHAACSCEQLRLTVPSLPSSCETV